MKKILAILAAILLIMALFAGCGGGDAPDSGSAGDAAAENGAEEADAVDLPEGDRLADVYRDMIKSGKYYMEYEAYSVSPEGEPTLLMTMSAAFAGDNSDTRIESGDMGDFRTLSLDGVTYMIDEETKTYTEFSEASEETTEGLDMMASENMILVDTGKDEIFGKNLPYEEYELDGDAIRYYFDGDELYAFVVEDPLGDLVMKVIEFSDKVPAGMLELPAGYTNQIDEIFNVPTDGMSEEDLKALEEIQKQVLEQQNQ